MCGSSSIALMRRSGLRAEVVWRRGAFAVVVAKLWYACIIRLSLRSAASSAAARVSALASRPRFS